MRVKPYAIRFPSRNARHTALSAPGGWMSTLGCSCRYRSSLRTCSGGPGETSCTGQYRYPVSDQRNGFPKSPATRHHRRGYECRPHGRADAHDNPGPPSHLEPLLGSTPYTTGLLATDERRSGCSGHRLDAGQPTLMPNRGRCEFVYLCAWLYITKGRGDRQFSIVIRIGTRRTSDIPGESSPQIGSKKQR
jgi:hypothetical protein